MSHRDATLDAYDTIHDDAIEYIETWYAHHQMVRLDEFCMRKHRSRRSVQRALKHWNTSWVKLIAGRRMTVAKKLLKTTGMPVHKVAQQAGYEMPSQFAKVFRRAIGMSPTDYRNQERRRQHE